MRVDVVPTVLVAIAIGALHFATAGNSACVAAQERASAGANPASSIDELLMQSDEPKEDAASAREAVPKAFPPKTDGVDGPSTLKQELGRAAVSEDVDRVIRLLERMEQVRWRLTAGDPGEKTQDLEREVVQELDRLIDQAQQQCSKCNSSSSSDKKPSASSSRASATQTQGTRPGMGTQGNDVPQEGKEPLQQVLESVWGELPERERRWLIQLPPETFLPKYRRMIENYFRKLSEAAEQDR